jgi:DNA-binding GntR family transcriptional regulator
MTVDATPLQAAQVYEQLRREILDGAFSPDQPISQIKLAERLGVSRTPLREALRNLQSEGLILSEPNRRVRVAPLSVTDLEELYAARITLEALAIKITAPRLNTDDLVEIDSALGEMDESALRRDYEQWEQPHRRFHEVLRRHAGARIRSLLSDLGAHSERYRRAYLAESIAWTSAGAEHHAIADACRRRDASASAELLARHLARTALTVIATIAPEHDAFPVRAAVRLVTEGPPTSDQP